MTAMTILRRCLGLLTALCLGGLIASGGCRPALLCTNDTNDLTLNPHDRVCNTRCDCNNQKYEGDCVEKLCQATLRESCFAPGTLRACDNTQLKRKGYQRCQPSHLYLPVWGDCRSDLVPGEPPPEPSEPTDASEHQMGSEKEPVEITKELPPDSRESPPEDPKETPPEPPDTCGSQTEICDDGLDNNCNGQIDEGCTPCSANQTLWQLKGHTGPGQATHHPWKPQLLTAATDGVAKLWDTTTGQEITSLKGHTGAITAIAYSPGGRRLATAGADGIVRLWDGTSHQLLRQFAPYPQPAPARSIKDIAFHPQGKGFFTLADGADGVVWWDDNGKSIATFRQSQQTISSRQLIRISPDGKRLAVLATDASATPKGLVLLWDINAQTPTYKGHLADLMPGRLVLAFHPGSQLLVTTSATEAQLWDLSAMKIGTTWQGSAHAAAWSQDGRRLALAQDSGVALWHFQGNSLLDRLTTAAPATRLSFSADGAQLAASYTSGGNVEITLWTCRCAQSGDTGACYSGQAGTIGRGICRAGQWRCDDQRRRSPCQGMQPPIPEAPDGRDEDCDGITDNGFVDLTIESLTVTPTSASAGTLRKIKLCVHNIGHFTSTASDVTVRLYLSNDAQIAPDDLALTGPGTQRQDLRWAALPGGQAAPDCKEISLSLPQGQPSGSYQLGAIIDPDAAIPESDETNNTASAALELKAP